MSDDAGYISGSMGTEVPHPRWCLREECTATADPPPFGSHKSRTRVIRSAGAGDLRVDAFLDRSVHPMAHTVLILEGWEPEEPEPHSVLGFRIDTARILHHAIGALLRQARHDGDA